MTQLEKAVVRPAQAGVSPLQKQQKQRPLRPPPVPEIVQQAFDQHPQDIRRTLLEVRRLAYAVAARLPEVTALEESLKWGQPSYRPRPNRIGTPVRLAASKDGQLCGLYVHCQTTLIAGFRQRYASVFSFEGARALLFAAIEPLPEKALADCIEQTFCYHRQAH